MWDELNQTKFLISKISIVEQMEKQIEMLKKEIEYHQEICGSNGHGILLAIGENNDKGILICSNCMEEFPGWYSSDKDNKVLNLSTFLHNINPDKKINCDENIETVKEMIRIFASRYTRSYYKDHQEIRDDKELYLRLDDFFLEKETAILTRRKNGR